MEKKANRRDVFNLVNSIIEDCTENEPAFNIKQIGEALMKIGEALEGVPIQDAKRAVEAAAILHGIEL